jgi:isopenicillin N synthase-like dioxygenase
LFIQSHFNIASVVSYRRTEEEEEKSKNVWIKGHTGMSYSRTKKIHSIACIIPDIGSVTILWSQPVSGLQILSPDGKWRWVRHMDNALVRLLYPLLHGF